MTTDDIISRAAVQCFTESHFHKYHEFIRYAISEAVKKTGAVEALESADRLLDDIDTCSDAHRPMYSSYFKNVAELCVKYRHPRREALTKLRALTEAKDPFDDTKHE